jgi:hypothetical protein
MISRKGGLGTDLFSYVLFSHIFSSQGRNATHFTFRANFEIPRRIGQLLLLNTMKPRTLLWLTDIQQVPGVSQQLEVPSVPSLFPCLRLDGYGSNFSALPRFRHGGIESVVLFRCPHIRAPLSHPLKIINDLPTPHSGVVRNLNVPQQRIKRSQFVFYSVPRKRVEVF